MLNHDNQLVFDGEGHTWVRTMVDSEVIVTKRKSDILELNCYTVCWIEPQNMLPPTGVDVLVFIEVNGETDMQVDSLTVDDDGNLYWAENMKDDESVKYWTFLPQKPSKYQYDYLRNGEK